jgi:hypothetical protein
MARKPVPESSWVPLMDLLVRRRDRTGRQARAELYKKDQN